MKHHPGDPVSAGTDPFALIAIAGLIPCLIVGNYQFIGYDGWWHLFTATQDNWRALIQEWKYVAHPPLFYPLLRTVARFGHSHLVLRSIGILCGCLGSYVFGIVASKLYRYRTSALLAAAAYTFAWNMIDLNAALRAYSMALLFVLLAFNAYIDWNADPKAAPSRHAVVLFGVYSVLGILTEYYVAFFVAGCAGILMVRALARPAFRAALYRSIRSHWAQWAFTVVSLLAVCGVLLRFHGGRQSSILWYLKSYYWTDDAPSGIVEFLLTNLEKETGYFSPFDLDPDVMLALAGLFILPLLIYFAFLRKDRRRGSYAVAPPLLIAALLAQLVILALAGRYPFGGEFRHQSVLAPFVYLTAFLGLDRIAGAIRGPRVRNAVFGAAGLLAAGSFAYGWAVYPWNAGEPESAEYLQFRTIFPAAENIYADALSWVFYYSQNHTAKWSFQDQFTLGERLMTVHRVEDGSGHSIKLLRDGSGLFDFKKLESYSVLAEMLRREKLNSIVLFCEGVVWTPGAVQTMEEKFRELAPLAGLEYGRSSLTTNHAFIEFKVR